MQSDRGFVEHEFHTMGEVDTFLDDLRVSLLTRGYDDQECFQIFTACQEALANAYVHGNGRDTSKAIRVTVAVTDAAFWIRIRDEGRGFDQGAIPDPTAPDRLEFPSGRGVLIMHTYMEEVRARRLDSGNEVVMRRSREWTPNISAR